MFSSCSGAGSLSRQVGVVGDDRVRRRLAAGGLVDEAGAAADVGEDADPAEADRLDLGDAERLVDALAELDVGALADVHELHVGRHAVAAALAVEAELVDEDDLDVAALGVELLHALVVRGLAAGQVGQAFAVDDGPVVVAPPSGGCRRRGGRGLRCSA